MIYLEHLLEVGCYSSVEMQSIYSTTPADWTCGDRDETINHIISEPASLRVKIIRLETTEWGR